MRNSEMVLVDNLQLAFRRCPTRKAEQGRHTRFLYGRSLALASGVTLTEVLMSIMILSIGIISLATLFPISILRSIQATQLTKATILRYNAESAMDVLSGIVHDPDGDTDSQEHLNRRYIVDPVGFHRAPNAALRDTFGNDGNGNPVGNLSRFVGHLRLQISVDDAFAFAALPDSWVDHIALDLQSALAAQLNRIDLSSTGVDLSDLQSGVNSGSLKARILLISVDGRSSHTRSISNISGQIVDWQEALPGPFQVGSVRIQTQEFRYTWLLTVRNNGGVAALDVVVLFRRPDPPAEEQVFAAVFSQGSRAATISGLGGRTALKKGGFILDATNARWYRVEDFTYQPNNTNPSTATITLAREAIEDGNKAIVMQSVVDVFPIRNRLP